MTLSDTELAAQCGAELQARGLHLTVAESCTGGLLGHLLTEVPGSSAWFWGGVIAYDDRVKIALLDVSAETIERYGAVSTGCAAQMAVGVQRRLGSDVALAITGIAGPGGGTAEKPVGTVYIALAGGDKTRIARYCWTGDRRSNKHESARAALELLQDWLAKTREG